MGDRVVGLPAKLRLHVGGRCGRDERSAVEADLVRGAFDDRGLGAVVNNSRAIIFAHARREYAQRFGDARWQEAVEAATRAMIGELAAEGLAPKTSPKR